MIDVSLELGAAALAQLKVALEADREAIKAEVALATETELRSRLRTLWPQLTGFSRDRMRVEDVAHSDTVEILNTAPYAGWVNNIARFPNGRANPNHDAVGRTIRKQWSRIVARALQRAGLGDSDGS